MVKEGPSPCEIMRRTFNTSANEETRWRKSAPWFAVGIEGVEHMRVARALHALKYRFVGDEQPRRERPLQRVARVVGRALEGHYVAGKFLHVEMPAQPAAFQRRFCRSNRRGGRGGGGRKDAGDGGDLVGAQVGILASARRSARPAAPMPSRRSSITCPRLRGQKRRKFLKRRIGKRRPEITRQRRA